MTGTLQLIAALGMVLAAAPTAQQSDGDIKRGTVYVSGENPVIRLSMKDGDAPSTNVSFWRVIYSPAGMGHVCYLLSDLTGDGPSPDDVRVALTDNQALLEYLNREIMSAFDKTHLEDPYPSQMATFTRSGDTLTAWTERVRSDDYSVELVWTDFYDPFQLDTPVGGPRLPYGITSMFLPARTAEVTINGTKAAGQTFPRMRGPMQSGTSFLAFSETWVK